MTDDIIKPMLDSLEELDILIAEELEEEGLENTPENRLTHLTKVINELDEATPDSLAKRCMMVMLRWTLENRGREIAGLSPIPTE